MSRDAQRRHAGDRRGLNPTNEDLEARSTEFQNLALSLEKLSGRDRSAGAPSPWNDLLSDDLPDDRPADPPVDALPPPAAAQTGKEA